MKFIWDTNKNKNTYKLEILQSDVIGIEPTSGLVDMERLANNSGKISDILMYLSELALLIEENKKTEITIKKPLRGY